MIGTQIGITNTLLILTAVRRYYSHFILPQKCICYSVALDIVWNSSENLQKGKSSKSLQEKEEEEKYFVGFSLNHVVPRLYKTWRKLGTSIAT